MNSLATDLLRRQLPTCPPPKCKGCRKPLYDIRPYRADQPHPRLALVHCLSRCGACRAPHIGVRALAPLGKGLRFLHQRFDLYTAERQAELIQVAEFLSRGEHPLELHSDQPHPDAPRFAVWFENALQDPERVAPAKPSEGLPEVALQGTDGIAILEQRKATSAGLLSGVLIQATNAPLALTWLNALRERARLNGTIAWCRRYDVPEHAIAWDTHTPSPGNTYTPVNQEDHDGHH